MMMSKPVELLGSKPMCVSVSARLETLAPLAAPAELGSAFGLVRKVDGEPPIDPLIGGPMVPVAKLWLFLFR